MKLRHNTPSSAQRRVDPEWAVRVEAEAQRTTDATEARMARAEARLARAEERLCAATEANERRARIHAYAMEVERRRDELIALHREMTASPAGAQHRGRGSHRGLPAPSLPMNLPTAKDAS